MPTQHEKNTEALMKAHSKLTSLKAILNRMKQIDHLPLLIVELTSVCQVKCTWCLMQTFNKIQKQHMPLEKFNTLIEKNVAYLRKHNTQIIPYSRGEPLIYPHFWDCCAIMRENNLVVNSICTNLSLKISVDDFLRHPIGSIVVNLGGTTKEVHEKCMIHSNFDLVTRNLRDLWAAGIPVKVKINPTRFNIHQLESLPEFAMTLGGKAEYALRYTTLFPHPDDLTEEERKFFLENVYCPGQDEHFRFTMSNDGSDVLQSRRDCPAHFMTDTIFANGNYTICCHDHHEQSIVDNVFETTIEELRSSEQYRTTYFRGLKRELVNCRYCV